MNSFITSKLVEVFVQGVGDPTIENIKRARRCYIEHFGLQPTLIRMRPMTRRVMSQTHIINICGMDIQSVTNYADSEWWVGRSKEVRNIEDTTE